VARIERLFLIKDGKAPATVGRNSAPGLKLMSKKCSLNIIMKEVINDVHTDHFYSPIYNTIFNWKNPFWKFAKDLENLQSSIFIPIHEKDIQITKLRIHSHGNKNPPNLHTESGPVIRMGEDNLSVHDFDQNDYPNSILVRDFLILLKNVLAPNSEITFDACNQKNGYLLKNISQFLGKDITVTGFSNLGNPFSHGNISFRNGQKIS
jgi:hypothetical protein